MREKRAKDMVILPDIMGNRLASGSDHEAVGLLFKGKLGGGRWRGCSE